MRQAEIGLCGHLFLKILVGIKQIYHGLRHVLKMEIDAAANIAGVLQCLDALYGLGIGTRDQLAKHARL